MTTSRDTQDTQELESPSESGFERREFTTADQELADLVAKARALGIASEAAAEAEDVDTTAAEAVVQLGFDQPVEEETTPIATFLTEDEEEQAEAAPTVSAADVEEPDAAWFAVSTYAGHEEKVRGLLDTRIRAMDGESAFVELRREQAGEASAGEASKRYALVPTQQEVEIRGGKRRQVERKLLPGYVLLQIRIDQDTNQLSDRAWYIVTKTDGVSGFVGAREESRDRAVPLQASEVAKIIGQTQVEEPMVRVGFEVNDTVRLTDGPFNDMVAEVEEINIEKGKVRVRISMFGRETPLELDFDQVEKQ